MHTHARTQNSLRFCSFFLFFFFVSQSTVVQPFPCTFPFRRNKYTHTNELNLCCCSGCVLELFGQSKERQWKRESENEWWLSLCLRWRQNSITTKWYTHIQLNVLSRVVSTVLTHQFVFTEIATSIAKVIFIFIWSLFCVYRCQQTKQNCHLGFEIWFCPQFKFLLIHTHAGYQVACLSHLPLCWNRLKHNQTFETSA